MSFFPPQPWPARRCRQYGAGAGRTGDSGAHHRLPHPSLRWHAHRRRGLHGLAGLPRDLQDLAALDVRAEGQTCRHRRRHRRRVQRLYRRQPLVPRSLRRRPVHGRRLRQPRSRPPGLRPVPEPLPQGPALPRHPLQPLLHRGQQRRRRQGHAQAGQRRQPEAAGAGRSRARYRQSHA